ncbi:hypothetical protein H7I76_26165, partial [Mycolicibacterium vaccae]|nr:hypothetical protein [Mycolicibacterium vaccae]
PPRRRDGGPGDQRPPCGTANPGIDDVDQHRLAVDIEIVPQARSIESPEFAARLAAAKRR